MNKFRLAGTPTEVDAPSGKAPARRKRLGGTAPWALLGFTVPAVFAFIAGLALFRNGTLTLPFASSQDATAIAYDSAVCESVIDRAVEISSDYCGQMGSNTACYGNNLVQAELAPGVTQRFSERGDVVGVNQLLHLSASALDPQSDEWGIAVFKLIANLPRSLPGQTITMLVFGNTRIENVSGSLETFYFSSEMGQIVCERAPQDGILINIPEGQGVRLVVNGTELTLMGNASLRATRFGRMEVSLFSGAGRLVADGKEQYFGAGQQVSVRLAGVDGRQSTGAPAEPKAISQDDLDTACALLGHYCNTSQLIPVTGDLVRILLDAGLDPGADPAANEPEPPSGDTPDPIGLPGILEQPGMPTEGSPPPIAPGNSGFGHSQGNNGNNNNGNNNEEKQEEKEEKKEKKAE